MAAEASLCVSVCVDRTQVNSNEMKSEQVTEGSPLLAGLQQYMEISHQVAGLMNRYQTRRVTVTLKGDSVTAKMVKDKVFFLMQSFKFIIMYLSALHRGIPGSKL